MDFTQYINKFVRIENNNKQRVKANYQEYVYIGKVYSITENILEIAGNWIVFYSEFDRVDDSKLHSGISLINRVPNRQTASIFTPDIIKIQEVKITEKLFNRDFLEKLFTTGHNPVDDDKCKCVWRDVLMRGCKCGGK